MDSNGKHTEHERQDAWAAKQYVDELFTLQYGGKGLIDLLRTIRINMATYSSTWIEEFLCFGGVDALMTFLPASGKKINESECNEVLKVFTTLANSVMGIEHMIRNEACIYRILLAFQSRNVRVKNRVVQLLGVMLYQSNTGHDAVLRCFNQYKDKMKESVRFERLVTTLKKYANHASLKTNLMTFLNILINTSLKLEERVDIRTDLAYHGLLDYIDSYRSMCRKFKRNEAFNTQIQVFDTQYQADRNETIHKDVDLSDVEQVFDSIYSRTVNTEAYDKFSQILRELLRVPSERQVGRQAWELIEEAVGHITKSTLLPIAPTSLKFEPDGVNFADERKLLQLRDKIEQILSKTRRPSRPLALPDHLACASPSVLSDLLSPASSMCSMDENTPREMIENHPTSIMIKDHPTYLKYFKLMKFGQAKEQVLLKAEMDGLKQVEKLELPPETMISIEVEEEELNLNSDSVKAKEHPKYKKYFNCLKYGLTIEKVENKMQMDGLEDRVSILNTPDMLIPLTQDDDDKGVQLVKDHADYKKYFKLLSMGAAVEAVKIKMQQNGFNPDLLDTPDLPMPKNLDSLKPKPKPKAAAKEKKLRSLYWDVMSDDQVSGTIWDTLDDEFQLEPEDLTGLETIFRKYPKKKDKTATNSKSIDHVIKKNTTVFLLDRSRSNNVSIVLRGLKLSCKEIRKALLYMDEKVLTLDKVVGLLSISPTTEEIGLVKAYSGDLSRLNAAERYYATILSIPRFTIRLESLQIKLQFPVLSSELMEKMAQVNRVCEELTTSSSLKVVLKLILTLGNVLNDGTSRGKAKGFKLSDLSKLNQLKGVDSDMSLLHYVAKVLRMKRSDLMEFGSKELPTLDEKVGQLAPVELGNQLKSLKESFNMIQHELSAHQVTYLAVGEEDDMYQEIMGPFLDQMNEIQSHLDTQYEQMEVRLIETMRLFGEYSDEAMNVTSNVFHHIYLFLKTLEKADRENEIRRIQKERREKRLKRLKFKQSISISSGDIDDEVQTTRSRTTSMQDLDQFSSLQEGNAKLIMKAFENRNSIQRQVVNPPTSPRQA